MSANYQDPNKWKIALLALVYGPLLLLIDVGIVAFDLFEHASRFYGPSVGVEPLVKFTTITGLAVALAFIWYSIRSRNFLWVLSILLGLLPLLAVYVLVGSTFFKPN